MLALSAFVPRSPMFIPEIGGEALKEVEKTVNGFLKLAIKIHSLNPEYIIIISPDAPLLHHRFSVTKGEVALRSFMSNYKDMDSVHLEFPLANELLPQFETLSFEKKIPIEAYTQEQNAIAIDNGALALLYYLSKVACYPKLLTLGVSDFGVKKHEDLGTTLGMLTESVGDDTKVVVIAIGDVGLMDEHGASNFSEAIELAALHQFTRSISIEDAMTSGTSIYLPSVVLSALMNFAWEGSYTSHQLSFERYEDQGLFTGFFQQKID